MVVFLWFAMGNFVPLLSCFSFRKRSLDKGESINYTKCIKSVNTLMETVLNRERRITLIFIDYNDKRPIYEQVVERMEALILNGILEPDSKLPSVRSMAMDLSINPNTIQRAYSELEREGLVYSVKGRGNFVKKDENLLERQREKLVTQFREEVKKLKAKGIEQERLLSCIREVYREDSIEKASPKEEVES